MATRRATESRPAPGRLVLREHIKDVLIERILDGTLPPGQRITEMSIAKEMGTSQSPVREAFRDLELLGLIESSPFRGTWVRELGADEFAESYPIRATLEGLAAKLAASNLRGDVSEIQAEVDGLAAARDLMSHVRHTARFHELVVEGSGNRRLVELWAHLQVRAHTMIGVVETDIDPKVAAAAQRPVVDAIAAQDGHAAEAAMKAHILKYGAIVVELLRSH